MQTGVEEVSVNKINGRCNASDTCAGYFESVYVLNPSVPTVSGKARVPGSMMGTGMGAASSG